MKILLGERLAPTGLNLLYQQAGWQIVESNPKEFMAHLADADALIIRSAIRITRELLAAAPNLRVIGRAGVGVDHIDIKAATDSGVVVMQTPGGNAVSVAEHTLALILSLARSIPQASESTKSGKWERKKFVGAEVRGKTLGIIGLGSIGREVAKRARAFEMRVIATDPFVHRQTAEDAGVELVGLDALYAESDYITLHMALTAESNRMLSREAFTKMKRGVRIVNCARGELIDQDALVEALDLGLIAGAAFDVFAQEPPPAGTSLFRLPQVIATPHIGGSTEEAQDIVSQRIAEQIIEFLEAGTAVHALNMPALTLDQQKAIGPYITLAERLGVLAAQLAVGNPKVVRVVYSGNIAAQSGYLIRNSGVAGVVRRSMTVRANAVNAMQVAADRGLSVAERHDQRSIHLDSIQLELETDHGVTIVEGAVVFDQPRLIQVDGVHCEAPLSGHVTLLKCDDIPGVIGSIGNVLGKSGVNIATFSLGRRDAGREAVALVETDDALPEAVLLELREHPAINLACPVDFDSV
jgi:D-3-phosphoglycerate dehydrogenase / 2-oxoglutarate reductase